ncbi:ZZ type zinc finger domain-containing protein [Arthroderma uncinatum]|uniref:ZZ type zinc finger domain-containing protein n=1 Tax=Arthroderma uncinatum TaxID=74035 RepID=UPI00144A70A7|nr:ZZ type zinc finger domain-containing protein [Arthroderma uncinatum]KAF3479899.1 ZZ type zinc finger domain-containing protein [Arthroderma uncinatum]
MWPEVLLWSTVLRTAEGRLHRPLATMPKPPFRYHTPAEQAPDTGLRDASSSSLLTSTSTSLFFSLSLSLYTEYKTILFIYSIIDSITININIILYRLTPTGQVLGRAAYLAALERSASHHLASAYHLEPILSIKDSLSQNGPVDPDTLITVKIAFDGENRRFKIPLRDLGALAFPQRSSLSYPWNIVTTTVIVERHRHRANTFSLPSQIRQLLNISPETNIVLQRYSDSAGRYLILDSDHPPVYKQLYRAAKAKLKLRIQVDRIQPEQKHESTEEPEQAEEAVEAQENPQESSESPEHTPEETELESEKMENLFQNPRGSYLETVLGQAAPSVPTSQYAALRAHQAQKPERCDLFTPLNGRPRRRAFPSPPTLPANTSTATYSCAILIDCNHCNASIPNEHYHCSICEDGDYDLCQECVDNGVLCPGGTHWLIKRSIIDGMVVNSTTEIVGPKYVQPPSVDKAEPEPVGTWNDEQPVEPKLEVPAPEPVAERTCNVCVEAYHVSNMVQCDVCHDFDVCFGCQINNRKHHNPAHSFSLIEDNGSEQAAEVRKYYCHAGGNIVHGAICDVCDCIIIGTRHKCLDCPNWDVCSKCVGDVEYTHPSHRFAALSAPLPRPRMVHPEVHTGVYCDGALCQSKMGREYVAGVRYKCVVCHDTDFCETCEAHPNNMHNRTHPLLKFKSPVKHVSVSAYGENDRGEVFEKMGDRDGPETRVGSVKSTATETVSPLISNAATQVHPPMTLNDSNHEDLFQVKEIAYGKQEVVEEKEVVDQPTSEYESVISSPVPAEEPHKATTSGLNPFGLHTRFINDTIPDGHPFAPDALFTKTWTLHNPGPSAWPAGTSARFVGGDAMFNVDTSHAISLNSLVSAMESQHLSEPVYPGQKAEFTVHMKAPTRRGRAISYWRLKAGDGVAFGHKLWCDINVTDIPAPFTERNAEMVFPTLDKESPVSSVHESSSTTVEAPESVATNEDDGVEVIDLTEDVESLTLDNESNTDADDGFLTDEEYDILDASDEEFAEASKASTEKK